MKKLLLSMLLAFGTTQAADTVSHLDDGGSGGKTIQLAVVGPYSKNDPVAEQIRMATDLALDEAREYITVNFGLELEIVVIDDENNIANTGKILKQIENNQRIVGVISASSSEITEVLVEQLAKDKIAVISATASSNNLTDRGMATSTA